MQSIVARKTWRTLEPYHAMIYFSPRATAAYEALGIEGFRGYFVSRSSPMGAVSAEVVIATFYNFHPDLVRGAMQGAWDITTPELMVEARLGAVDATLRELLGDDVVSSSGLRTASEVARRATEELTPEGRPLYAAHAALDWPEEPHLVLWHAITLLREYRGDGHIAALVLHDIDACEALVTHAAQADGLLPPDVLKVTRAWPEDQWQAAIERLQDRGWIDAEGKLTPEGQAGRDLIEQLTDERAMRPWLTLGEELCEQLRDQVRPLSKTIVANGGIGRVQR